MVRPLVLRSAWLLPLAFVLACGADDGGDSTSIADATTQAVTSSAPPGTTDGTTAPVDSNEEGNTLPCTGSLQVDTNTLPDGTAGEPYETSVGWQGPAGWDALAVGEIPGWMMVEIDDTQIHVTGTPDAPGFITITILLGNGDGAQCGGTEDLVLTVLPGPGGGSTDGDSSGGTTGESAGSSG